MAQLSGVMTADFSDFHFEIDKSVTKLKGLENASAHTSESMDEFSGGIRQVDQSLSAVGIRIGPQIRALEELRSIANKSVADIGALGLAGAITSTGIASYEATRAVIEFVKPWYDLDTAIATATASMLGWGDVAMESARAKAELLARATQILGKEITDVNQALLTIKQHNKEVAESFNTGTLRVEQWTREISAARAKGDLPKITEELKNHTSTVQELSTHYGISTRALEFYTRTLGDSAKAQKAWADEARPRYEALAKAQEEINNAGLGWQKTVAAITPATAALVQHYLNLDVSVSSLALKYGLTETQVKALDTQMKYNLATMAATEPALGTLDEWIKTNVADTKAWNTEWRFTSEVIDTEVIPSLDALASKATTVQATVAAAMGVAPGMDQKAPGANIPINTGNITYQGGFEAVFAEFIRKQGGGGGALGGAFTMTPQKDFLTWALSMGLAQRAPITNTFNIVDTESNIARRVSDTISSQIQQGSLVN